MNPSCHECTDDWECKASAGDCTSSSRCASYGEQSFCSQIKEENCEPCEIADDCEEKECHNVVCVDGECVYTYRSNCDPDKPEAYYCQHSQAKDAALAGGSIVALGSVSKCWSFIQNNQGDRFYFPGSGSSSYSASECCPTLMAMNCIPGPCEEDPDEDPDEDQEEYEQGKSDLSSWEPGPDSFDSEITDLDLGEEFVDARDGSLSEEGWFSDVFGNSLSTVLKSANIQLDSPQCSFSFQINLFRVTDSLTFDFCPYKEFLSNLGKFFVSIATLTSVMIIIGRG